MPHSNWPQAACFSPPASSFPSLWSHCTQLACPSDFIKATSHWLVASLNSTCYFSSNMLYCIFWREFLFFSVRTPTGYFWNTAYHHTWMGNWRSSFSPFSLLSKHRSLYRIFKLFLLRDMPWRYYGCTVFAALSESIINSLLVFPLILIPITPLPIQQNWVHFHNNMLLIDGFNILLWCA